MDNCNKAVQGPRGEMFNTQGGSVNKVVPINQALNNILKATVQANREKLKPIVKTILLCGRQNIALRGHRDDSTRDDKENPGNFQVLLDFRIDSGDHVLEEHFKTAAKNATYTSKTVQNELISCCGELITNTLCEEVRDSKFFSVLADEAQDCSNKEQMPVIIRFIDKDKEIREEFFRFMLCDSGVSGKALAKVIKDSVKEIGLDMKDCRGQEYDGAGNMAGKCAGAAARIHSEYPLAIYMHCTSHKLNLCVASSCSVQMVKNMMDTVRVISDFFNNSPKRQAALEKKIEDLLPAAKHKTLINVCHTRWIARIDGLDHFEEMFEATTAAFCEMRDNLDLTWNADTSATASGLVSICADFQFIISLVITRSILDYARSATVKLQESQLDMFQMFTEVNLLLDAISKVRDKLDLYHSSWYEVTCELASTVQSEQSKPRTCSRQMNRANSEIESIEQYYRVTVSAPLLDHLQSELSTRFSKGNCSAMKGFAIIPTLMFQLDESSKMNWRENFS